MPLAEPVVPISDAKERGVVAHLSKSKKNAKEPPARRPQEEKTIIRGHICS